jgi:tRNA (mo5U34)-methyltransferase
MENAEKVEIQKKIDSLTWYHEIDFGSGLRSVSKDSARDAHRRYWRFIESQLNLIDFRGKSVLDIGCWDGYWSFYAERRGAAEVLATDDFSQNWSRPEGLYLAKHLLDSKVEIIPDCSVYELVKLGRKFDIVIFVGVYYHLWDPFYAFSQVRHSCRTGGLIAVEGNICTQMPKRTAFQTMDMPNGKYLPSQSALEEMLTATYMRPAAITRLEPSIGATNGTPEEDVIQRVAYWGQFPPIGLDRIFVTAEAIEDHNRCHVYKPPFNLDQYDPRFVKDGNAG